MARCFVIQPFDGGGPYDKRYKDVLLPAIKDADLDAYRVDEDRSSSIPIDDIEQVPLRAMLRILSISVRAFEQFFKDQSPRFRLCLGVGVCFS
jgi:hypothetical protein